jgi:hypothetical protein
MPSRAIPTSGKVILAGLVTLCGLASTASQQSEPDQGIPARQTEMIKPTVTHVASAGVPSKANPQQGGTNQGSVEGGTSLWSTPLTSLTATRERPIFAPTRRPRATTVNSVAPPASSSAQPPLVLVGAIAGETEGIAIFQDGTTKGVIRLKTGESHAGWILQAVKKREAVLQNERKDAILELPSGK